MNKLQLTSLALNVTSVISLGSTAVILPAVVGLETYGHFVAMCATPLIVGGLTETWIVAEMAKDTTGSGVNLAGIAFLYLAGILVLLWVSPALFVASVALIVGITLRAFVQNSIVAASAARLGIILVAEIVQLLIFFSLLVAVHEFAHPANEVKYLVFTLAASTVCGSVVLYWFHTVPRRVGFSVAEFFKRAGALLSRTSEDSFFTALPAAAVNFGGGEFGAVVKIVGSISKGLSKLIPYRYDTFSFYVREVGFASALDSLYGRTIFRAVLAVSLAAPAIVLAVVAMRLIDPGDAHHVAEVLAYAALAPTAVILTIVFPAFVNMASVASRIISGTLFLTIVFSVIPVSDLTSVAAFYVGLLCVLSTAYLLRPGRRAGADTTSWRGAPLRRRGLDNGGEN